MSHIGHNGVPAVTKGTFADFKLVKTRGVAQFVIEVPIEQAGEALEALGGLPTGGDERWVALARLDLSKAQEPAPAKPSRPWNEMSPAQQAGVLCNDRDFILWLRERYAFRVRRVVESGTIDPTSGQAIAAAVVRDLCGITSRSDLDPITNPAACEKWRNLASNFFASKNLPPIEMYRETGR